jgi:nucleotide-binding universal stress UspA family protein
MALRWAADQARLAGAPVVAAVAWDYPAFYLADPQTYLADPITSDEHLSAHAAKHLADAVAEVVGSAGDPPVEQRVVHGHPAQVLLDVAEGAQLLVVGSHGYHRFAAALLGSVALTCVQRAHCPVVIVRQPDD